MFSADCSLNFVPTVQPRASTCNVSQANTYILKNPTHFFNLYFTNSALQISTNKTQVLDTIGPLKGMIMVMTTKGEKGFI